MNWDVGRHTMTDEDIREMPETLRERIATYQEQRREGQKLMHQLANPDDVVLSDREHIGIWAERLHRALFYVVALLAVAVVLLSLIAVRVSLL
jgi:hypothetical protein